MTNYMTAIYKDIETVTKESDLMEQKLRSRKNSVNDIIDFAGN